MQLQRLEGFYWVARTQGYARAARAFPYPITQPGVHRQVRRLEEDMGLRLVERVGKDRIALTPAGRRLYDYVAPFYEGLQSLERSLKSDEVAGVLTIFAAGLHLRQLLPPWLRRLQKRYPQVEVALHQSLAPDLGLLRDGTADLLVDHFASIPADIEAVEIGQMHAYIVVPASHPLGRRRRVVLADLGGEAFVAYHQGHGERALQFRALEGAGAVCPRVYGADSAETILGIVSAGVGVSVVPALAGRGVRAAGVVAHRLTMPEASFAVHAAWRRGRGADTLRRAALEAFGVTTGVGS